MTTEPAPEITTLNSSELSESNITSLDNDIDTHTHHTAGDDDEFVAAVGSHEPGVTFQLEKVSLSEGEKDEGNGNSVTTLMENITDNGVKKSDKKPKKKKKRNSKKSNTNTNKSTKRQSTTPGASAKEDEESIWRKTVQELQKLLNKSEWRTESELLKGTRTKQGFVEAVKDRLSQPVIIRDFGFNPTHPFYWGLPSSWLKSSISTESELTSTEHDENSWTTTSGVDDEQDELDDDADWFRDENDDRDQWEERYGDADVDDAMFDSESDDEGDEEESGDELDTEDDSDDSDDSDEEENTPQRKSSKTIETVLLPVDLDLRGKDWELDIQTAASHGINTNQSEKDKELLKGKQIGVSKVKALYDFWKVSSWEMSIKENEELYIAFYTQEGNNTDEAKQTDASAAKESENDTTTKPTIDTTTTTTTTTSSPSPSPLKPKSVQHLQTPQQEDRIVSIDDLTAVSPLIEAKTKLLQSRHNLASPVSADGEHFVLSPAISVLESGLPENVEWDVKFLDAKHSAVEKVVEYLNYQDEYGEGWVTGFKIKSKFKVVRVSKEQEGAEDARVVIKVRMKIVDIGLTPGNYIG